MRAPDDQPLSNDGPQGAPPPWHIVALEMMASMGDMYGTSPHTHTPAGIFETAARYLKRVTRLEQFGFLTVDEQDASFEFTAWAPADGLEPLQREIDHLIEGGQFAWALNQNRPVNVEALHAARPLVLHVLATRRRVRGMFVAIVPDGQEHLSAMELHLLSIIMHNCAHALENTELYRLVQEQNRNLEAAVESRTRELQHSAGHDGLTGLPNRMLFEDRLKQALVRAKRYESRLAVLLLDIDLFNRVNESLGHSAGDVLLKAIVQRLLGVLRSSDTVTRTRIDADDITLSRLGGDEFCILITDLDDADRITRIAQRIFEALAPPFDLHAQEVYITTSLGIALYPNDGDGGESLLQRANIAMHHAKHEGRNNYQFYSKDINKISFDHLQLESQLRHALENGEFLLHYQPKVDIGSGCVTGAEALIRWRNSAGRMIPPVDFIPFAEEHGLIAPIGEWVLREACRQTRQWIDKGMTDMKIAVNLSAHQIRDRGLAAKIGNILRETRLPAEHLELELTESAIFENIGDNAATLRRIHELGVRLSIDDFGTGYSSLSHLKRFPIDSLKIDRSFVKDITSNGDDAAIVSAIVAMAHKLKLNVIAEGVETREHLSFLSGLLCDQAQGYFYSRPVSASEYVQFLLGQCQTGR